MHPDIMSFFSIKKLEHFIGAHNLKPEFSVSFCQSDGCAFVGNLSTQNLLDICIYLEDVKSITTLLKWMEFIDVSIELDSTNKCCSQTHEVLDNTLSTDAIYNELNRGSEYSSEIHNSVMDIAEYISELIVNVSKDCYSDLRSLILNSSGKEENIWSFKTKNFQIVAFEHDFFGLGFDSYLESLDYQQLRNIVEGSHRGLDLEVRLLGPNDTLIDSIYSEGIITEVDGCVRDLIRQLASDLISDYRYRSSISVANGGIK